MRERPVASAKIAVDHASRRPRAAGCSSTGASIGTRSAVAGLPYVPFGRVCSGRLSGALQRPEATILLPAASVASGGPTCRDRCAESVNSRLLLPSPGPRCGHFHAMPNIKQQKKRVRDRGPGAAREPPLRLDREDLHAPPACGRGRGRPGADRRGAPRARPLGADKAAARGALHRNAAARKKAQAAPPRLGLRL